MLSFGNFRPNIFQKEIASNSSLELYQNTSSFKDIIQNSFWTLEAAVHRCSTITMFLIIATNSQKSTCVRSSFESRRPASFSKRMLEHRGFHVNFSQFLRISFLQNTSGRLLLANSVDISDISRWLLLKTSRSEDFSEELLNFLNKRSSFV